MDSPNKSFQKWGALLAIVGGLMAIFYGCSNPVSSDKQSSSGEIVQSFITDENSCFDQLGCVKQKEWGQVHTQTCLDFYPWLFDQALPYIEKQIDQKTMKPDEAWKYIGDEFYKRYNHDFLTIEETEGLMKMVGSDENPMRDFQSTIDQAVVENWSIDTFSIAVSDFANSLNVINGEHEQLMIQVELLVSSFYVWQEVEQLNGLGEAGFVIGCDGLGLGLGGPGGAAAASIASCVVLIAYYTWFA